MPSIEEINTPVAQNIKQIIEESGLKQRHIANVAGFTESEFSAMLNGRKIIRAAELLKIASALQVTPNDLFTPRKIAQ